MHTQLGGTNGLGERGHETATMFVSGHGSPACGVGVSWSDGTEGRRRTGLPIYDAGDHTPRAFSSVSGLGSETSRKLLFSKAIFLSCHLVSATRHSTAKHETHHFHECWGNFSALQARSASLILGLSSYVHQSSASVRKSYGHAVERSRHPPSGFIVKLFDLSQSLIDTHVKTAR